MLLNLRRIAKIGGVLNLSLGLTQRRKDAKKSQRSFGVSFAAFAPLRETKLHHIDVVQSS